MIGRVTVLALAVVAGIFVSFVDAAPIWTLCVLAALAWGVLIVFVLRGKRVHE